MKARSINRLRVFCFYSITPLYGTFHLCLSECFGEFTYLKKDSLNFT